MLRNTLLDFFRDFDSKHSLFLVFDDGYRVRSYTYSEVAGAARKFAERLKSAGVRKEDKVILWGENRPEWVVAFWGCLLSGAVAVPVDFRASLDLVTRIERIVQAHIVVAGDQVTSQPAYWKLSELDWTPGAQKQVVHSQGSDLCEIIFTSGATAQPKGVTITHSNLLANIVPVEEEIRKYRALSIPFSPIRFLNLLPLSHLFGQTMATFIPPLLTGEVVFMTSFNPREIVRQIASRRISVSVSVPKILDVLRTYLVTTVPGIATRARPGAKWFERWWHYRVVHNLFGWKFWCFVVGAAPLDPELEEFWSNLGFLIVQGYGLTETAPIVTLNHPFHTSKGSVGKPIAGVEIKVAPDGEILVRGANVTAGYFDDEEASSAAIHDGWFQTGDIGGIDKEGQVFIRGRKKEMIVTPEGLNVFPEDLERVLNDVPGVKESAVVGVSENGSERPHAVLVLEPGTAPEAVVGQANRILESHQQIRTFSVWNELQLPRTEGTEKLKRVAIRDWLGGRGDAPKAAASKEILSNYSDETRLDTIGLSSLDRVELMIASEQESGRVVSEAALAKATTVGDLRRISSANSDEPVIPFPRWNQTLPARICRRFGLPALLLPLLRIFVWLRIEGRANLSQGNPPFLFAVNHQSVLDVPTLLAALPTTLRFEVCSAMGMDWFHAHFHPGDHSFFDRLGNHLQYYLASLFFNAFPIPQREAGARDSLRYMGELVSAGSSILIFPEGVRTAAGEIAPFRPGVGMIASRLKIPVVPVRIRGLNQVLPQGSKIPQPGRVVVSFGEPLEILGDDYAALARRIEAAVQAL